VSLLSDTPPEDLTELPVTGIFTMGGESYQILMPVLVLRDRLTAFEAVGFLLLIIVLGGGGLFLYCRSGGRFPSELLIQVDSTNMDYHPADYASKCRKRIFANDDIELDPSLGPKTLEIRPASGAAMTWRLREDVVEIIVAGEQLAAGEKRLVYPGDKVSISERNITIREEIL